MARPRKPTNILELKGSFDGHPERLAKRANEPKAVLDLGRAPRHLDALQTAAYKEIARLAHAGVMCAADAVIVEAGAVLLARMRRDPDAFTPSEFGRLHAVLSSLGMTPVDRSKVSVRKVEEATPMDEFKRA